MAENRQLYILAGFDSAAGARLSRWADALEQQGFPCGLTPPAPAQSLYAKMGFTCAGLCRHFLYFELKI